METLISLFTINSNALVSSILCELCIQPVSISHVFTLLIFIMSFVPYFFYSLVKDMQNIVNK